MEVFFYVCLGATYVWEHKHMSESNINDILIWIIQIESVAPESQPSGVNQNVPCTIYISSVLIQYY